METALLLIESSTGAVRAMVGGWDFSRSQFNRATQAKRQVGSAFKPFVYGAAIEAGFTPADTLFDAPVMFAGATGALDYSPRNYKRRYLGILTLRRALEDSINVTATKLLDLVGVERVIEFARRCGIESGLPPYPSLALGTADLTPMELATAFSTLGNQGLRVDPYMIERITARDGTVLEQHVPQASQVVQPEVAYVLTHMLRGVIQRGTAGSAANLGLDLAGKTGTTDSYTDAWFVGYTPRYTLLVWVGYDQERYLGRGMTGAVAALPIWRAMIERGVDAGLDRQGGGVRAPARRQHAADRVLHRAARDRGLAQDHRRGVHRGHRAGQDLGRELERGGPATVVPAAAVLRRAQGRREHARGHPRLGPRPRPVEHDGRRRRRRRGGGPRGCAGAGADGVVTDSGQDLKPGRL